LKESRFHHPKKGSDLNHLACEVEIISDQQKLS